MSDAIPAAAATTSGPIITQQAPVLLIPEAVPLDFCRDLIAVWETQGNEDSGFMVERDGKTVGEYNYSHKIRRDHFVKDAQLNSRIQAELVKKIIPKIREAFAFDVTRKEDFRIACYDAERGGYFRPHRDNTTGATAHRRFAISLFLNDEFEGGYVRFPEYSPGLYRMPAGGAVVFSCSVTHEATDVISGKRFVLLTFFYGEKEAMMREQYNLRTGGEYRAGKPPTP